MADTLRLSVSPAAAENKQDNSGGAGLQRRAQFVGAERLLFVALLSPRRCKTSSVRAAANRYRQPRSSVNTGCCLPKVTPSWGQR